MTQDNERYIPFINTSIGGSILVLVTYLLKQLRQLVGDPKKALIKYLKSPDYNNQVAFVEKFHEDFKKIVDAYAGAGRKVYVFIDDLDRCEFAKAADLMQALNLMISNDPHIIFILGMDREKVAAGLAVKSKDILPYLPSSSIATDDKNKNNRNSRLSGIEYGYSFLEKFIQIPFQVPQPTKSNFQYLLEKIAPVQIEKKSEQTQEEKEPQPRKRFKYENNSQKNHDIVMMVAPALDNNPRRLKQFINLFRLKVYIASNTGLLYEDEVADESQETLTLEQLGKFTAICVKWPQLIIDLETNRDLLNKLQKFAFHDSHESKKLQKFALHVNNESDEYDDLTKEWGSKPKLVELLCYPEKQKDITSKKSRLEDLEDKYSLENVDIDKLSLVSPGTQDDLRSERQIDYTELRNALEAHDWEKADDPTR